MEDDETITDSDDCEIVCDPTFPGNFNQVATSKPEHAFIINTEHPFGSDFADDLERTLAAPDLGFSGNYCHFKDEPSAPNPSLSIEDFGSIGLPLSPREAKALISHATALPQRNCDGLDRKIWEIDGSQITFQNNTNDLWSTFIKKSIGATIWNGLGVPPYQGPLGCRLSRMIVAEAGATNLMEFINQDVGEEVFARILLQLPSTFTGGECRFDRDSQTHVLNLADKSQVTSVLGLYIDSKAVLGPITAGYQLLLCYDVIHRQSSPRPPLPSQKVVQLILQHILQRRKDNLYRSGVPDAAKFVYVYGEKPTRTQTQHTKPPAKNSTKVTKNSKGQIDKAARYLIRAAKEAGYAVHTGRLELCEEGPSDSAWDPDAHDYENEEEPDLETAIMEEIEKITICFKKTYKSNGICLPWTSIRLSKSISIPPRPFIGVKPKREFDDCPYLKFYYRRDALLIVTKEEEANVMKHAPEEYWSSIFTKDSISQPTTRDRELAAMVPKPLIRRQRSIRDETLRRALEWNDPDLWKATIDKLGRSFAFDNPNLLIDGLRKFPFGIVRSTLENILTKIPVSEYSERLDFLRNLKESTQASPSDRDAFVAWCSIQCNVMLDDMDSDDEEDYVAGLAALAKEGATSLPTENSSCAESSSGPSSSVNVNPAAEIALPDSTGSKRKSCDALADATNSPAPKRMRSEEIL